MSYSQGLTLQASASCEAIPEDLKRRCLRVEDLLLLEVGGVRGWTGGSAHWAQWSTCTGSGRRKNEGVTELVWKNAMQAALQDQLSG